jgi:ABC-type tungstate transport system permease subunit
MRCALTAARQFQTAAALLKEYTITDRGTWLSTPTEATELLTIYNEGSDDNEADPLLNPAFFLSSTQACPQNKEMAKKFIDWVIDEKLGQKVIAEFTSGNSSKTLYTAAPTEHQAIMDCSAPGLY